MGIRSLKRFLRGCDKPNVIFSPEKMSFGLWQGRTSSKLFKLKVVRVLEGATSQITFSQRAKGQNVIWLVAGVKRRQLLDFQHQTRGPLYLHITWACNLYGQQELEVGSSGL